jgi:hypothetical protein
MKTVNLLPDWYLQQNKQRRFLRVHIGVMALLAASMVAVGIAGHQHVNKLGGEAGRLKSELANVTDPEIELKRCQADLTRLQDLQMAYRELGKTIPMSAVIQQMQNDMTPGMALAHVGIDVRSDPVKGSGMVGDVKNPPKYHDVAYLSAEGIAPNDVQIAQLIEKLAKNPLFAEVTLDYTRTGTLQQYLVRRFVIRMKMDLERLTTEDPDASSQKIASGVPGHDQ